MYKVLYNCEYVNKSVAESIHKMEGRSIESIIEGSDSVEEFDKQMIDGNWAVVEDDGTLTIYYEGF